MKKLFFLVLMAAFCASAFAQSHRIVVERKGAPADSTESAPDTLKRMTIDPGEMIYQMKVDSIYQATEAKVKSLIEKLERKFEDPKVEEEVGKLIGDAVMEQQLALLDLQIDRAISVKDTLLMKGLEVALQQLMASNPKIQETIRRQIDLLERELKK